ncbi:hypothetical protein [Stenotrophobium rhamnosiphilum]|uniref:Uncharacterized protein n=1 Tax=Stenotrophobium rhamnosiphilum TaxID=2029166 RepID=A0A2T5MDD0_9GAMM|nr:hypothetical protein [Stenotrophobium rhamnosiphilum]PTU30557.1 hypothetical protein CJD38_13700 [Stenotrophobium rhamnosiphilum]
MNAEAKAERASVLRRLDQQRHRIKDLLGEPHAPRKGMANAVQNGFPRSQTMRALMSEPMLKAGLSVMAVRLLGPRAMQLLLGLTSAFRVMRNVHQHSGHQLTFTDSSHNKN